jgi:hypothetical protein
MDCLARGYIGVTAAVARRWDDGSLKPGQGCPHLSRDTSSGRVLAPISASDPQRCGSEITVPLLISWPGPRTPCQGSCKPTQRARTLAAIRAIASVQNDKMLRPDAPSDILARGYSGAADAVARRRSHDQGCPRPGPRTLRGGGWPPKAARGPGRQTEGAAPGQRETAPPATLMLTNTSGR